MIEQQGEVVTSSHGEVLVRLGGRSGCAACDAGRGCGAGLFGRLLRRRALVLPLDNVIGAQRGQAVIVGLPESWFLALVTRFYLYPLLAGLVGAALGHYVSAMFVPVATVSDSAALLAALLAGFVVVWRNRRWSANNSGSIDVHLLRVVDQQKLESEKEVVS